MLTVLAVFWIVGLAYGQVMSGEDQTPDRLQLYQLLDEKADQIAQIAQDVGAAIDALRSGRAREFLKGSMALPGAPQTQSDIPVSMDSSRFQGPIGSSFGHMESFPLMAAPVVSVPEIKAAKSATEGLSRSKRSYYGGRRYGSYGGYGSSNGYGSRYGGYGSSYGGYGRGYGRGYGYGGYGSSRYYG